MIDFHSRKAWSKRLQSALLPFHVSKLHITKIFDNNLPYPIEIENF